MTASTGVEPSRPWARWCGLLVAVVACWQVHPVVGFDFVEFDDGINIVFNPHLGPLSAQTVSWAWTDLEQMRRFVPIGWMGLAAVYEFSGLAPAGYHAVNAAAHVLNSVLVYAIVWALLGRLVPGGSASGRAGWSVLGALFWSLHPLRAETMGWASGLFYGLSGAAALGSVLAYLRAWKPGAQRGPWVAAAAVLHLAGMLAYPMSLGVVVVFVLIDLAMPPSDGAPGWRRLAWEKTWFVLPTLAVLTLTVAASHAAPDYWVRPPAWSEFGLGARLLQAGAAWAYYLGKPWWPWGLTPVPTWLFDPGAARAAGWAGLLLVGGVSAALVAGWPRGRGVALLWFAHAGLLAPLLGFFEQPYFPSDRYHYLAGVVLAAGLALAAARAAPRIQFPVALVGLAAVSGLGALQRAQLRIWENTDTLMARIVARAEHPAVLRNYQQRWVGFHATRGDLEGARRAAAAAGLDPDAVAPPPPGAIPAIAALHLRLGLDFGRAGRRVEAREHLRAALHLVPDWTEAAYNLALVEAVEGAPWEALRWYRRAAKPGRGEVVPAAARQRLLALVAEALAFQGRERAVEGVVALARRDAGADAEWARQLRTRLAPPGEGERR